MVKYFLYGFSSFLFLTNAYAGSRPESLAKIIYEKEIDLNQDRIKDKLVIEENSEGKSVRRRRLLHFVAVTFAL